MKSTQYCDYQARSNIIKYGQHGALLATFFPVDTISVDFDKSRPITTFKGRGLMTSSRLSPLLEDYLIRQRAHPLTAHADLGEIVKHRPPAGPPPVVH
jgi:hypothetical protein